MAAPGWESRNGANGGPAVGATAKGGGGCRPRRVPRLPRAYFRNKVGPQSCRRRGRRHCWAGRIISSCSAQTSASTRSGEPDPTKPRAVICAI